MKIEQLMSNSTNYFASSQETYPLSLFLNSRFKVDANSLKRSSADYHFLLKNKKLSEELQQVLTSYKNFETFEINKFEATLVAEKYHKILFENDHIRILNSHIQPNETVPLHNHPLPGIMAILTESNRFLCIDSEGKIVEETWEASIYEYDGSLELNSFKNIGNQIFKALIFELKK